MQTSLGPVHTPCSPKGRGLDHFSLPTPGRSFRFAISAGFEPATVRAQGVCSDRTELRNNDPHRRAAPVVADSFWLPECHSPVATFQSRFATVLRDPDPRARSSGTAPPRSPAPSGLSLCGATCFGFRYRPPTRWLSGRYSRSSPAPLIASGRLLATTASIGSLHPYEMKRTAVAAPIRLASADLRKGEGPWAVTPFRRLTPPYPVPKQEHQFNGLGRDVNPQRT